MRVKVKETGQEVIINVSDYKSSLHAKLKGEPALAPSDPASDPAPDAPFNLSEANAKDAVEVISETDDLAALEAFEREESSGKARKGVMKAIEERFSELAE
jgi:hypothetical protein